MNDTPPAPKPAGTSTASPSGADQHTHAGARSLSWTESKTARDWIGLALGVLTAFVWALEWVIHRHAYGEIEKITGVFVLFGLGGMVLVVILGRMVRSLFAKAPDHYSTQRSGGFDG